MNLKFLILILLILGQTYAVIYKGDLPQDEDSSNQSKILQKGNQIRRRFKNEEPIEPLPIHFCLKFDFEKYQCAQCFDGFLLKNKHCVANTNFNLKNNWNELSFIRISSPSGFTKTTHQSTPDKNPFCSQATSDGALCLTCHKEFILINGDCVQKSQELTRGELQFARPVQAPKNTFCEFYGQNGQCVKCFSSAVYNGTDCVINAKYEYNCRLHQNCLPQSTECLTYSSQGICKQCSKQAINVNGICRLNKVQSLCQQIGQQGKCKKCTQFATLFDGVCKYKSPHCVQYNADNTCNICRVTYRRINGQCIRPSKIMFINLDPMCSTWKQGVCIQCQYGYGFYQGYCIDLNQIQAAGFTPETNTIKIEIQN